MLSNDLLSSSKFARFESFKIVKTKISKNKMGVRVSAEMLLKIKNKQTEKNIIERIITVFLNTEIMHKE